MPKSSYAFSDPDQDILKMLEQNLVIEVHSGSETFVISPFAELVLQGGTNQESQPKLVGLWKAALSHLKILYCLKMVPYN